MEGLEDSMNNGNDESTYIFGAGEFARKLKLLLELEGLNVEGFLCSKEKNSSTLAPGVKFVEEIEDFDSPIVLGVFNHFDDPRVIENDLRALGFRTIISPAEVFSQISIKFSKYYLTSEVSKLPTLDEIYEVEALLEDAKSREILQGFTRYQRGNSTSSIPQDEPAYEQYLGNSLPEVTRKTWLNNINRVVDVGAYTGDSLKLFCDLENTPLKKEFICLEPDKLNFEALEFTAMQCDANIVCLQVGAGASPGLIAFEHSGKLSSSTNENLDFDLTSTPIIKLDSLILSWSPSLIKMDIEGAELDALKGAAETIKVRKPNLAISVYHHPKDIVDIPRFIYSLCQDYKFFLRSYGKHCYDTVLYCVI